MSDKAAAICAVEPDEFNLGGLKLRRNASLG